MSKRKIIFQQNHFYHIFNRGCNKNPIFLSDDNYLFLLRRIKKISIEMGISVIAYCLMPNHYHFLLRQDRINSISSFLQSLFNSYSKAFNKMYDKSGTLFEGQFKAILISNDNYLVHLCRYIHRNPVDAGLVKLPSEWIYSNYLDWIGRRNGTLIDRSVVDSFFKDKKEYESFVNEYVPPKKLARSLEKYFLE